MTTFAVLADTHVRAAPHDPQACFPSDAHQTARCARAVALCRVREPAFVVHLGDVTHTLPGLPEHAPTQARAQALLGGLGCPVHVCPGNHDVGDKPGSRAAAPASGEAAHLDFEARWGPAWRAFDHGGCRFVLLDSPVLGTGTVREAAQWAWLESTLAGASRSFLFLHYPPFLLDPDEPAHYDNLAPGPRARLLDLCERNHVEAVFAGHVHGFFHHRHRGTEHWIVPSTAFCRPEYAELFPVGPTAENGRDDPDKLGFFLVHVEAAGHRIEWVCPHRVAGDVPRSPAPSPLGVWLRGAWARVVDLPAGDLDPFDRKRAREDWTELHLLDLGIRRVRVQLADLLDPVLRERIGLLRARRVGILAASPGPATAAEIALIERERPDAWELIVPPGGGCGPLPDGVPVVLSVVDSGAPGPGGYHSHFPAQGFRAGGPLPGDLPPQVQRLAFRVPWGEEPGRGVAAAVEAAARLGRAAVCHLALPGGDELHPPADPDAAVPLVRAAARAARAHPDAWVFLDLLHDKDRGYHPRWGLLDRRCNPRAAALALRER